MIHLELYDIIWNNLSAWKINNKTGMPTSETNFLIDKLILEAHFYTTPKDKFIKIYSKEIYNRTTNILENEIKKLKADKTWLLMATIPSNVGPIARASIKVSKQRIKESNITTKRKSFLGEIIDPILSDESQVKTETKKNNNNLITELNNLKKLYKEGTLTKREFTKLRTSCLNKITTHPETRGRIESTILQSIVIL